MKFMKGEKGVTLTELMIATAASTIIAYTIFVAIRIAQTQMDTASVSMTIQSSAREGLYRMVQEIRETSTSRVSITDSGGTITFNVPDPSSPVTAGYAVNWPGHTIQYTRGGTNSSQIIRTNSTTGQTAVIANDVTALTFTNTSNVVTVAMNVQRNLVNGRSIPATAITMTGQARIRNTG
jgi:hypothetical protein